MGPTPHPSRRLQEGQSVKRLAESDSKTSDRFPRSDGVPLPISHEGRRQTETGRRPSPHPAPTGGFHDHLACVRNSALVSFLPPKVRAIAPGQRSSELRCQVRTYAGSRSETCSDKITRSFNFHPGSELKRRSSNSATWAIRFSWRVGNCSRVTGICVLSECQVAVAASRRHERQGKSLLRKTPSRCSENLRVGVPDTS